MRITQGMMSNNMLTNLTKSYASLNKYMDQLNTGKKINKPSDDPFVAIKSLDYRSQLAQVEQYKSNASEVHLWMDNSDEALNSATSALQRLQDLARLAANDTNSESERKNIAEEAKQIRDDLISVANMKVNDRYIFNGTDTKNPLVETNTDVNGELTIEINENQKPVNINISENIELQANVDGGKVFGGKFFENINKLVNALEDDDQAVISESIDTIQENVDAVINERASLGARMNRLDLVENRLSNQENSAKNIMSKNENVDIEVAITNLLTQETMHRAALSAGARIMQPTLVDFLR